MFKFENVSMTKNKYCAYDWYKPGHVCTFNEKNEETLLFDGGILYGESSSNRSICVYNTVSHEIYFYHKVMCFHTLLK